MMERSSLLAGPTVAAATGSSVSRCHLTGTRAHLSLSTFLTVEYSGHIWYAVKPEDLTEKVTPGACMHPRFDVAG